MFGNRNTKLLKVGEADRLKSSNIEVCYRNEVGACVLEAVERVLTAAKCCMRSEESDACLSGKYNATETSLRSLLEVDYTRASHTSASCTTLFFFRDDLLVEKSMTPAFELLNMASATASSCCAFSCRTCLQCLADGESWSRYGSPYNHQGCIRPKHTIRGSLN